MKFKSLLVAAAAFVALGMNAQPTISMPDIDLNDEANIGVLIELPMTLTMPDGDDFTNIQFHVVFPEGVRPALDDFGSYGFGGDDIPLAGRPPASVVTFSDNFNKEEFYPEYDVIGANMNKVPVTANPCHFYTMNVICDETAKAGQFKLYMKYTKANNEAVELGTSEAGEGGVPVYTEYYTPEGGNIIKNVAVTDVNTTKAVSSVTYYNAAGMASETAFDGINIVVTKYADGSQSTTKIVK